MALLDYPFGLLDLAAALSDSLVQLVELSHPLGHVDLLSLYPIEALLQAFGQLLVLQVELPLLRLEELLAGLDSRLQLLHARGLVCRVSICRTLGSYRDVGDDGVVELGHDVLAIPDQLLFVLGEPLLPLDHLAFFVGEEAVSQLNLALAEDHVFPQLVQLLCRQFQVVAQLRVLLTHGLELRLESCELDHLSEA